VDNFEAGFAYSDRVLLEKT